MDHFHYTVPVATGNTYTQGSILERHGLEVRVVSLAAKEVESLSSVMGKCCSKN